MKTYWCVTVTIFDNGRVTAAITASKDADYKPESHFTGTSRRDIYTDWFDRYEDAEAFVKEAKEV